MIRALDAVLSAVAVVPSALRPQLRRARDPRLLHRALAQMRRA